MAQVLEAAARPRAERAKVVAHSGAPPVRISQPAVLAPAYPVESSLLQADRVALSLRGALERISVALARSATALVVRQAWCDFGFARLDDYARERLGRSGRWVRDLAALGERLPSLPALALALIGGDGARPIGRAAALLIAKVATPESLDRWIAAARCLTFRALRDAVRAARAQDADAAPPPGAPAPPVTASQSAAPDDDLADRHLVRMLVPSPVLAAFDEAVDLFRAVEGGEATVASFVEALVAEAGARGDDRDDADDADDADAEPDPGASTAGATTDLRSLDAGVHIATVEHAFAASTGNWSHLPEHAESSWALSLAGVTLARFHALATEAGQGGPVDLDRQLRALVDIENEMETRLGGLLADLGDRRAWPRLRFAGVGHYGEERLGLSRTTAEDRARLARELRNYPRLRDAYDTGHVSRESAALVVRLLRDTPSDAASEAAWVARAAESTIKRMRDEVRALGRYRVLGPRALVAADAPLPSAAPMPFAAPMPSAARLRTAAPLDDATWHASLRREPGLARRRVRAFGHLALTSPDVFQALPLEPDAYLRLRLPLELARDLLATVEAECRRLTADADALPWDADMDAAGEDAAGAAADAAAAAADSPGPPPSRLLARTFSIRCRRLPAWVGLLALLEDFVDTWDAAPAGPRRPGDAIYIRDGWRCAAPGCTSRRNLEDHHLRYRSRGGDDGLANRICLCRFHHQRGEHGGLASCRGTAPTGVIWRLGRRDAAPRWYTNERRVAAPTGDQ
jgi:hypothetical protein